MPPRDGDERVSDSPNINGGVTNGGNNSGGITTSNEDIARNSNTSSNGIDDNSPEASQRNSNVGDCITTAENGVGNDRNLNRRSRRHQPNRNQNQQQEGSRNQQPNREEQSQQVQSQQQGQQQRQRRGHGRRGRGSGIQGNGEDGGSDRRSEEICVDTPTTGSITTDNEQSIASTNNVTASGTSTEASSAPQPPGMTSAPDAVGTETQHEATSHINAASQGAANSSVTLSSSAGSPNQPSQRAPGTPRTPRSPRAPRTPRNPRTPRTPRTPRSSNTVATPISENATNEEINVESGNSTNDANNSTMVANIARSEHVGSLNTPATDNSTSVANDSNTANNGADTNRMQSLETSTMENAPNGNSRANSRGMNSRNARSNRNNRRNRSNGLRNDVNNQSGSTNDDVNQNSLSNVESNQRNFNSEDSTPQNNVDIINQSNGNESNVASNSRGNSNDGTNQRQSHGNETITADSGATDGAIVGARHGSNDVALNRSINRDGRTDSHNAGAGSSSGNRANRGRRRRNGANAATAGPSGGDNTIRPATMSNRGSSSGDGSTTVNTTTNTNTTAVTSARNSRSGRFNSATDPSAQENGDAHVESGVSADGITHTVNNGSNGVALNGSNNQSGRISRVNANAGSSTGGRTNRGRRRNGANAATLDASGRDNAIRPASASNGGTSGNASTSPPPTCVENSEPTRANADTDASSHVGGLSTSGGTRISGNGTNVITDRGIDLGVDIAISSVSNGPSQLCVNGMEAEATSAPVQDIPIANGSIDAVRNTAFAQTTTPASVALQSPPNPSTATTSANGGNEGTAQATTNGRTRRNGRRNARNTNANENNSGSRRNRSTNANSNNIDTTANGSVTETPINVESSASRLASMGMDSHGRTQMPMDVMFSAAFGNRPSNRPRANDRGANGVQSGGRGGRGGRSGGMGRGGRVDREADRGGRGRGRGNSGSRSETDDDPVGLHHVMTSLFLSTVMGDFPLAGGTGRSGGRGSTTRARSRARASHWNRRTAHFGRTREDDDGDDDDDDDESDDDESYTSLFEPDAFFFWDDLPPTDARKPDQLVCPTCMKVHLPIEGSARVEITEEERRRWRGEGTEGGDVEENNEGTAAPNEGSATEAGEGGNEETTDQNATVTAPASASASASNPSLTTAASSFPASSSAPAPAASPADIPATTSVAPANALSFERADSVLGAESSTTPIAEHTEGNTVQNNDSSIRLNQESPARNIPVSETEINVSISETPTESIHDQTSNSSPNALFPRLDIQLQRMVLQSIENLTNDTSGDGQSRTSLTSSGSLDSMPPLESDTSSSLNEVGECEGNEDLNVGDSTDLNDGELMAASLENESKERQHEDRISLSPMESGIDLESTNQAISDNDVPSRESAVDDARNLNATDSNLDLMSTNSPMQEIAVPHTATLTANETVIPPVAVTREIVGVQSVSSAGSCIEEDLNSAPFDNAVTAQSTPEREIVGVQSVSSAGSCDDEGIAINRGSDLSEDVVTVRSEQSINDETHVTLQRANSSSSSSGTSTDLPPSLASIDSLPPLISRSLSDSTSSSASFSSMPELIPRRPSMSNSSSGSSHSSVPPLSFEDHNISDITNPPGLDLSGALPLHNSFGPSNLNFLSSGFARLRRIIENREHARETANDEPRNPLTHLRDYGGLRVFASATCPICLDDHNPVVALKCGHIVCEHDFRQLGGYLASDEERNNATRSDDRGETSTQREQTETQSNRREDPLAERQSRVDGLVREALNNANLILSESRSDNRNQIASSTSRSVSSPASAIRQNDGTGNNESTVHSQTSSSPTRRRRRRGSAWAWGIRHTCTENCNDVQGGLRRTLWSIDDNGYSHEACYPLGSTVIPDGTGGLWIHKANIQSQNWDVLHMNRSGVVLKFNIHREARIVSDGSGGVWAMNRNGRYSELKHYSRNSRRAAAHVASVPDDSQIFPGTSGKVWAHVDSEHGLLNRENTLPGGLWIVSSRSRSKMDSLSNEFHEIEPDGNGNLWVLETDRSSDLIVLRRYFNDGEVKQASLDFPRGTQLLSCGDSAGIFVLCPSANLFDKFKLYFVYENPEGQWIKDLVGECPSDSKFASNGCGGLWILIDDVIGESSRAIWKADRNGIYHIQEWGYPFHSSDLIDG